MFVRSSLILTLSFTLFLVSNATLNCTGGSVACDPLPTCCQTGDFCNFNRGIPVCENPNTMDPVTSGFNSGMPCSDPYLWDCSSVVGVAGVCCPIGTICLIQGVSNEVSCVDALGSSTPALSSSSTGFMPPSSPVNDGEVTFQPSSAWSSQESPSCAVNKQTWNTNSVNASVSFNFTGPSIMIHTVQSAHGGVFGIIMDGTLLIDFIDTFNSAGELCSPTQYPPFVHTPPNFGTTNSHSVTLFYQGPSSQAPNGTVTSGAVFDSFAMPQFNASETQIPSSSGADVPTASIYVWRQIAIVVNLVIWSGFTTF